MAIVHQATLTPTKIELLERWLSGQDWYFAAEAASPVSVGAFRFDDPAGEVGIETHLVAAGDGVFQVPLTYRGAPLAGAEAFLVGTMEHSVLGSRWVYDATGDPVYVAELARSLFAGADQVPVYVAGSDDARPESVHLTPVGYRDGVVPRIAEPAVDTEDGVTSVRADGVELAIRRVLDLGKAVPTRGALSATWQGQAEPVLLAAVIAPTGA